MKTPASSENNVDYRIARTAFLTLSFAAVALRAGRVTPVPQILSSAAHAACASAVRLRQHHVAPQSAQRIDVAWYRV